MTRPARIGNCVLYQGDCINLLKRAGAFDHVLTDPPYLYLKQAFDRVFDETALFEHIATAIPATGFVTLFGRGTSFYRWNSALADRGFKFKEEVIWNKVGTSSPTALLLRSHETCSLHTRRGVIRTARIPYLEQKKYDPASIVRDIKRLKSLANSPASFKDLLNYFKTNRVIYRYEKKGGYNATTKNNTLKDSRHGITTAQAITKGMRERSIMTVPREANCSHPTQKPVRLIERLLAIMSDPGDTIFDPFMGSGSVGVACINTGRKYIGIELDPDYFAIARGRIREAAKKSR